ncbi:hypothetical protein K7432_003429 [Basidiobolus ranarum]|uniref:Nucleotidyl transferase domain-containing protein n=1 Tax=Basidiobolus ranarum TaxID=34480 RepID=A0ABR2W726_9FUNG
MCSLKVIFLSAGYGTRLQRDIEQDISGKYSSLLGLPKALVPLGNYDALLTRWWELLQQFEKSSTTSLKFKLDNVYIITNETHHTRFQDWASKHNFPRKNIFNNHTLTNETRLGAVKDLELSINSYGSLENTLVIGADILLLKDFELENFFTHFSTFKTSLTTHYVVTDTQKNGILELDNSNCISNFLEKPKLDETNSRFACPCFYLFKKEDLKLIKLFLAEMSQQRVSKEATDAPGNLIKWLYKKTTIHSVPITGRLDIGGLDSYVEADEYCKEYF